MNNIYILRFRHEIDFSLSSTILYYNLFNETKDGTCLLHEGQAKSKNVLFFCCELGREREGSWAEVVTWLRFARTSNTFVIITTQVWFTHREKMSLPHREKKMSLPKDWFTPDKKLF